MPKKDLLRYLFALILCLTFLNPVYADSHGQTEMKSTNMDKPRGQLLYETHCAACHDQSVHKRKPRKADSVAKIKSWVSRWSTELKLNWSGSDIDAVASYLNSKYYKFNE